MSTPLQPVITNAGLQKVFNATRTGLKAEITHVALGSSGYEPTQAQTKLQTEQARIPVGGGQLVGPDQIHITAIEDTSKSYWLREVGFLLSDGTLFAIWATPDTPLAYKSGGVDLLLGFDLVLAALPADSVTIDTSQSLSLLLAGELASIAAAVLGGQARDLQALDRIAALEGQVASLNNTMSGLRAYLNI